MDKFKIDSQKLSYHPRRVAQVLDAQNDWELAKDVCPIYVEVSPVGHCNHKCKFCAVDYLGYTPRSLDTEIYSKRIKGMGAFGVKSVMFAGEGEPLLHKQINDLVLATKAAGIDVAFTINAVLLNEKFVNESLQHCSWIKTSINAGSAKTYAEVHQTREKDFDIVLNNLRYAVEYKHKHNLKVTLGAQCVVLPDNIDEVVGLALMLQQIGLDYLVLKPYSQHNSSNTREYENIDYSKYEQTLAFASRFSTEDFKVIVRSNAMEVVSEGADYDKCLSTPNLWAYIMSDGTVSACSAYLGNPRFELGNINTQTFYEIWQGDKRKALFEEGINISECRKGCRMDSCNRYLSDISNSSVEHVNFI